MKFCTGLLIGSALTCGATLYASGRPAEFLLIGSFVALAGVAWGLWMGGGGHASAGGAVFDCFGRCLGGHE